MTRIMAHTMDRASTTETLSRLCSPISDHVVLEKPPYKYFTGSCCWTSGENRCQPLVMMFPYCPYCHTRKPTAACACHSFRAMPKRRGFLRTKTLGLKAGVASSIVWDLALARKNRSDAVGMNAVRLQHFVACFSNGSLPRRAAAASFCTT